MAFLLSSDLEMVAWQGFPLTVKLTKDEKPRNDGDKIRRDAARSSILEWRRVPFAMNITFYSAMTVLDVMTTQLRACEEKLSSIQDYKENELTDLYRLAEEAINAMKAEQDAIEAALPQLADKERHGAMERLSRIDLMESNAKSIQDKLTQLHAHTGELCDLLEPQTTRLKHLETQIQYFQLLLEVETLSARAKPSAGSNGDIDALVALAALNQSLSTHFGMDVSFQLNLRVCRQRMAFLAVELQAFHTNALDASVDALRWPQVIADTDLASKAVEVFRDKFTALVQVQLAVASVTPEGVESEPLVRRFHFHFDTHVKTNDVSKPEWYLTHVIEVLRGHILFLESVVRPALARGLVESSTATRSNNTDGVALFIHGLLQPVCAKLKQSLPILVLLLPIAKVTLHQASIVPLKLKQTVAGLSKSVLNHPLLETQEAKNVTHGLLGQGSLVLPTAAFSAAYSVGSTLFRSLQRPKDSVVEVVRAVDDDAELDERESDTYTLDGSIFQNEWTWFQAGVQTMEEVLVTASSAAIRAQWAAVDRIVPDVSPEFTGGVALFRHHLVFAHASLNPSSFEMYWKALSKELDGHVLAIVLQLKGSVRRLVEASAVLHMPTAKARVLGDALATQHKLDMSSVQIQTMLEASQLHALTPSNVSTLLRMGA
ncbi:hypothetical protein DYB37_004187 [Aphanomyces astaci]|uniref:Uncharacterized protein n=1 Tax=Aphanomyces astaci TaxID=112090 RepID=A0A3R6XTU2_APHAT|nr:hypothetical protein DYB37_004187 [Aphanomyces astaci]